jgi:hypothetical protein
MTELNVAKVDDPSTTVSLSGCPGCQAFWFDGGVLDQLRLSFDGQVREPAATPRRAGSVEPDGFYGGAVGVDIASIFDGFDFGGGD